MTREALVKFYGSLSFSLRTLIHYRVLAATGKPFEYFLVEEPWSVYGVLERAMGVHNAELLVHMLKHWLEKNGCLKPVEEIKNYLRERGAMAVTLLDLALLELRGVTLVYGAAGAGKTTFTAWWVRRYGKVFWVSAFEDEATFRANMARLGYEFGGRLVFWEAPLGEAEAFFNALVDAVAKERPEALVVDSVTAFLPHGGLDLLQNLVYRVVRKMGVDVFLTAERQVAEQLTYLADNVIELKYEVNPYGSFREMVVRKVRGGPAGYTTPFIIVEGEGFAPLALPPGGARPTARETGTCIDKLTGGVYKGAATAVVGPVGLGRLHSCLRWLRR